MKFIPFGKRYLRYSNTYSVIDTNTFRITEVVCRDIEKNIQQYENVRLSDDRYSNDCVYVTMDEGLLNKVWELWTSNLDAYEPSLYLTTLHNDLFVWCDNKLFCHMNLENSWMPILDKGELRMVNLYRGVYTGFYYLGEMSLQEYKRTVLLDKESLYRRGIVCTVDRIGGIEGI